MLPALVVIALGAGLSYAPLFIAATSAARTEDQGAAPGLIGTAQQLGPAMGLAAIAGVASAVTGTATAAALQVSGSRPGLLCAARLTLCAAVAATRFCRARQGR